ncbi:hypothetical protein ABI59_20475 [Acidobacteria bacterium Mor1]|nr:hypothetical protein ABI59_20475 [Acidobacteria bacterium Mor1]
MSSSPGPDGRASRAWRSVSRWSRTPSPATPSSRSWQPTTSLSTGSSRRWKNCPRSSRRSRPTPRGS